MRVSDIMIHAVHTVGPEATLKEVALLICRHHVSGVPVVAERDAGRLAGIVSERDVLKALYPTYDELIDDPARSRDFVNMESRYQDVAQQPMAAMMTRHVLTADPDMPALQAASLMLVNKVRRLPVVESGCLVGIVSLGDVHQAIFERHFGRD